MGAIPTGRIAFYIDPNDKEIRYSVVKVQGRYGEGTTVLELPRGEADDIYVNAFQEAIVVEASKEAEALAKVGANKSGDLKEELQKRGYEFHRTESLEEAGARELYEEHGFSQYQYPTLPKQLIKFEPFGVESSYGAKSEYRDFLWIEGDVANVKLSHKDKTEQKDQTSLGTEYTESGDWKSLREILDNASSFEGVLDAGSAGYLKSIVSWLESAEAEIAGILQSKGEAVNTIASNDNRAIVSDVTESVRSGLRPIPELSTDIKYSPFPIQDLAGISDALGFSDVKVVTTATLEPKRAMFHAVLNGIQTYIKLGSADEAERATEIDDLAKDIYSKLLPDFLERMKEQEESLSEKKMMTGEFCTKLASAEDALDWSEERFNTTWNIDNFPPRWQKKAIETYKLVRNRIENGEYDGKSFDAASATLYWSLRNMEYKHFRDVARNIVEDYIQENYEDRLLTMQPIEDRTFGMFVGAIASGKTELTKHYLRQMPEERAHEFVLNNADYLKLALFNSAKEDGRIPEDHKYEGSEVQAESSNALFEGVRKRTHLLRQFFAAPNAIVNSMVLGEMELLEGIASGGKVVAHHINISPEDAVAESNARNAGGRIAPASDVSWSNAVSAGSLLILTTPRYAEANVVLHLYDRERNKSPEYYGSVDARNKKIYIADQDKFLKLGETAFPNKTPAEAKEAFQGVFEEKGFEILTKSRAQAIAMTEGAIHAR